MKKIFKNIFYCIGFAVSSGCNNSLIENNALGDQNSNERASKTEKHKCGYDKLSTCMGPKNLHFRDPIFSPPLISTLTSNSVLVYIWFTAPSCCSINGNSYRKYCVSEVLDHINKENEERRRNDEETKEIFLITDKKTRNQNYFDFWLKSKNNWVRFLDISDVIVILKDRIKNNSLSGFTDTMKNQICSGLDMIPMMCDIFRLFALCSDFIRLMLGDLFPNAKEKSYCDVDSTKNSIFYNQRMIMKTLDSLYVKLPNNPEDNRTIAIQNGKFMCNDVVLYLSRKNIPLHYYEMLSQWFGEETLKCAIEDMRLTKSLHSYDASLYFFKKGVEHGFLGALLVDVNANPQKKCSNLVYSPEKHSLFCEPLLQHTSSDLAWKVGYELTDSFTYIIQYLLFEKANIMPLSRSDIDDFLINEILEKAKNGTLLSNSNFCNQVIANLLRNNFYVDVLMDAIVSLHVRMISEKENNDCKKIIDEILNQINNNIKYLLFNVENAILKTREFKDISDINNSSNTICIYEVMKKTMKKAEGLKKYDINIPIKSEFLPDLNFEKNGEPNEFFKEVAEELHNELEKFIKNLEAELKLCVNEKSVNLKLKDWMFENCFNDYFDIDQKLKKILSANIKKKLMELSFVMKNESTGLDEIITMNSLETYILNCFNEYIPKIEKDINEIYFFSFRKELKSSIEDRINDFCRSSKKEIAKKLNELILESMKKFCKPTASKERVIFKWKRQK